MLAGGGHQFFLTDNHQRWLAKESYLLRLKRPGSELELVNPKFKFEWSDHFDATGSNYAFSGREAGQGSSAVYLRNLATGETRTLVEDNGTKLFSLPNFYGTNVIYSRSNQLWRVDFTGRNHERVFPPPEAPESR
jgi:Tol biopolymer transport system component